MSDDSDGFEWVGADDESSGAASQDGDSGSGGGADGVGTEDPDRFESGGDATPHDGDDSRPDAEKNAATNAASDDEEEEYEPSIAGVFGARSEEAPPRPEIVPETPELENVLFVVLGVLLGLFVIYRAVVVFGG
ncbi:DUF7312 domain-containing protein [Salinarchaeum laminariae]|uniref:DUF7312 domain-containing protein n=1 Tax=Salinarchaeum laminariae TaxID=869888 RepID=UPI0020BEE3D4|nr:hypothetical protein [Salinarchaeum laminariae]